MGRPDTHVLLTTDAVGGIWTYALDLGRELARRRHRVTLAVIGPGFDQARARAAAAAGIDTIGTGLRPEWLADDETEIIQAGSALARTACERHVDIVHLNHPAFAASAGFRVPVLAMCHSCVATWWEAVRGTQLPEDFRWRTDLVARGYQAAQALVAPSRAFASATHRLYGLAQAPAVIHNGRSPIEVGEGGAMPADAVFVAGRLWDEAKNLAALDRAAQRIAAPVRAAGPTIGPNGASIAFGHIETLGVLDEVAVLARLAERPIYVSTAVYEPFGLAVLEAAQAGCALVLSDIPTFRELWEPAAIFVPASDEEAIAAAVNGLLADRDLRRRLGEKARARALGFGLESLADGVVSRYRHLLEEGRSKENAA